MFYTANGDFVVDRLPFICIIIDMTTKNIRPVGDEKYDYELRFDLRSHYTYGWCECEHCNKGHWNAMNSKKQYCSKACHNKDQLSGRTYKCAECNKVFPERWETQQRAKNNFCCNDCKVKFDARPSGKIAEYDIETLWQRFKAGESVRRLAKSVGCARPLVEKAFTYYGFPYKSEVDGRTHKKEASKEAIDASKIFLEKTINGEDKVAVAKSLGYSDIYLSIVSRRYNPIEHEKWRKQRSPIMDKKLRNRKMRRLASKGYKSKKYKDELEFQDHIESEINRLGVSYEREKSYYSEPCLIRVDFVVDIDGEACCVELKSNFGKINTMTGFIGQCLLQKEMSGLPPIMVCPDDVCVYEEVKTVAKSCGIRVMTESEFVLVFVPIV